MKKTRVELVHTDTLSCEAILRKAPNGELVILSQIGGTMEPAKENRVYAFHSKDVGRTWNKTVSVYPEDGRAVYCTEVYVFDRTIYAFLTTHDGHFLDFENVIVKSEDSGYSWEKTTIDLGLEGFVFVRGIIPLSNNRFMIPYQQYEISKEENNRLKKENDYVWKARIDEAYSGVLTCGKHVSDVKKGGRIAIPLDMKGVRRWQWPEPTLVELSDRSVVMLVRINYSGRLHKSVSDDFGVTWSPLEPTELDNPGNKPKLIGLKDGRIALLNTFRKGTTYKERQPLSVWISDDDMATWTYKKKLIMFPGWHSYPDGIESDDGSRIWFSFEFNRHDVYFVEHVIR